jgi:hypothetical protein
MFPTEGIDRLFPYNNPVTCWLSGIGCVSLPLMSYVCITDAFGIGDCFTQRLIVNVMTLHLLISLITLTAMTVERYMGILHPIKHRNLMTKLRETNYSLVCGTLFITACNALFVLQSQLLQSFLDIYILLFPLIAIFDFILQFLS